MNSKNTIIIIKLILILIIILNQLYENQQIHHPQRFH